MTESEGTVLDQPAVEEAPAPAEASSSPAAEDTRRKYSRDELVDIGKRAECKIIPEVVSEALKEVPEFRDLDKRVEPSPEESIALKPHWARPGAGRGEAGFHRPPGFGGPPGPIRSRLVDQGDIGFPLEKPERERPSLDGPGPRGAPGGPPPRPWRPGQDKDEKWEGWGAHNHERNERPDPRGEPPSRASGEGRRWGEKAPADNWRAGGPGGKDHRDWRDERGGHNGGRGGERERERELRPRGRWEENEAWGDKRRGNDRPNKDEGGGGGQEGWFDGMPKPRGAMTMQDIEKERQMFREQHAAGQRKQAVGEPRPNDLNALFMEEVDINDLMDDEQRAEKGLPSKGGPPGRGGGGSSGAAGQPQGIKMSFMDLAKAAGGGGSAGSAGEKRPGGSGPAGEAGGVKVMSLDALEKKLTGDATASSAEALADAKRARAAAGAGPGGVMGPPPGMVAPPPGMGGPPPGMGAPPPGFKADAQASQTLLGLLKKPAAAAAAAGSQGGSAEPSAAAAPAAAAGADKEAGAAAKEGGAAANPLGALGGAGKAAAPGGGLGLAGAFSSGGGLPGFGAIPQSVLSAFGQGKDDAGLAAISSIWGTPQLAPPKPSHKDGEPGSSAAPAAAPKPAEPSAAGAVGQAQGHPAAAGQANNPLAALFAKAAAQQAQQVPPPGPPLHGVQDPSMAALLGQLAKQQQAAQAPAPKPAGEAAPDALANMLRDLGLGPDLHKQGAAAGIRPPVQPGGPAPGQPNKALTDLLASLQRPGGAPQAAPPPVQQPALGQDQNVLHQLLRNMQQQQQQQQASAGQRPAMPGAGQQQLLQQQQLQQLLQQQQQQQAAAAAAANTARPAPGAGFNPQLLAQLQQAVLLRPPAGQTGVQQIPGMVPGQAQMQRPPAGLPGGVNALQLLQLQQAQAQAQAQAQQAQLLRAAQAQAGAGGADANSLARFFSPAMLGQQQRVGIPMQGGAQPLAGAGPAATTLADIERLMQQQRR